MVLVLGWLCVCRVVCVLCDNTHSLERTHGLVASPPLAILPKGPWCLWVVVAKRSERSIYLPVSTVLGFFTHRCIQHSHRIGTVRDLTNESTNERRNHQSSNQRTNQRSVLEHSNTGETTTSTTLTSSNNNQYRITSVSLQYSTATGTMKVLSSWSLRTQQQQQQHPHKPTARSPLRRKQCDDDLADQLPATDCNIDNNDNSTVATDSVDASWHSLPPVSVDAAHVVVNTASSSSSPPSSPGISLGKGSFSNTTSGVVEVEGWTTTPTLPKLTFLTTPRSISPNQHHRCLEDEEDLDHRENAAEMGKSSNPVSLPACSTDETSCSKDDEDETPQTEALLFCRHSSSFLRVSDLDMSVDSVFDNNHYNNKNDDTTNWQPRASMPHFHHSTSDPPPGIALDSHERWVALDMGSHHHSESSLASPSTSLPTPCSPLAPVAIRALATTGWATLLNRALWTPDAKTRTHVTAATSNGGWAGSTFDGGNTRSVQRIEGGDANSNSVLIWTGSLPGTGCDIPAIRSAAIIPHMSCDALFHLLVDSNRVSEYNSMSLGRTDLHHFPNHDDDENHIPSATTTTTMPQSLLTSSRTLVTKIMRSESRPPLIRKTLQFTTLLHARALENNGGYLLVSRAVHSPNDIAKNNTAVVASEILLSVNWIRPVLGNNNKLDASSSSSSSCLLVTVNHIRSPLVPMMIAKRLGLQAAVNFVTDLRTCAAKAAAAVEIE